MDFWLEVCLFGLTPSVNKESGTHNGSSVASNTPPVWNHELYSDPSIKSVNVPLTLIFSAYRSLQRLNVPNHLANQGPRGIYVNDFLTLPLKYRGSLHLGQDCNPANSVLSLYTTQSLTHTSYLYNGIRRCLIKSFASLYDAGKLLGCGRVLFSVFSTSVKARFDIPWLVENTCKCCVTASNRVVFAPEKRGERRFSSLYAASSNWYFGSKGTVLLLKTSSVWRWKVLFGTHLPLHIPHLQYHLGSVNKIKTK